MATPIDVPQSATVVSSVLKAACSNCAVVLDFNDMADHYTSEHPGQQMTFSIVEVTLFIIFVIILNTGVDKFHFNFSAFVFLNFLFNSVNRIIFEYSCW